MRVVHISDIHLGYRAYNRINNIGINAREADVFSAFRDALAAVRVIEPDIIIIAGDLFHVVRPSNLMIQYSYNEFTRLRREIAAPIVILGGNHDSPRSTDTGCILDLYSSIPDIHVAHSQYVKVPIEKLDMSVYCLSHRALPQISDLKIEPDPDSKYNLLAVHGTVEGVIRHAYDIQEIKRADVISDAWDYIAFGHYHVFTELAPNAYYSGSLEYTSSNIWSELGHPKGFIEYDLDERRLVKFHEVNTREAADLRPIDASEHDAAELTSMIRNRVESVPGGYQNKIIRLVVENLHRSVQVDIDFSVVRQIRAEALHFDLQLRPPRREKVSRTGEPVGAARSLEEEWGDFAGVYELPAGLDRDVFINTGRDYLVREGQAE